MYILFLSQDKNIDNTLFLGVGENPAELFVNALNPNNLKDLKDYKKSLLFKWLILVESHLDETEKKDLEYAFMRNPENEFSYAIKDMTLCIKRITNWDSTNWKNLIINWMKKEKIWNHGTLPIMLNNY